MKLRALLAAFAVGGALMGPASAATVLFSDDFNSDALGLNKTSLTHWNVTSGTVDVIGTGLYPVAGSGVYIDMDGSNNQPGTMQTKATIGLAANQTYRFSFDLAKNGSAVETLIFGFLTDTGAELKRFELTMPAGPMTTFAAEFVNYTSQVAQQVRLFFGTTANAPANEGPVIDNVKLAAVPLPAAGLLLLGGLAGMGLLRRRRDPATA